MPESPPKQFMDETVKSLSQDEKITDPKAVAGWIWHHWITAAGKKKWLKKEKKPYDINNLPPPKDFSITNTVAVVRLVPKINRLIEVSVLIPKPVWNKINNIIGKYPDVETKNKERRMIRRGAENKATNIFFDSM